MHGESVLYAPLLGRDDLGAGQKPYPNDGEGEMSFDGQAFELHAREVDVLDGLRRQLHESVIAVKRAAIGQIGRLFDDELRTEEPPLFLEIALCRGGVDPTHDPASLFCL